MSVRTISDPFPKFNDLSGNPLKNGKVYVGVVNKNPEVYPISVYWDEALTIPVEQPIRTISGYLSQNGSPGIIYAATDYSITVRDKNDNFLLTQADSSQSGSSSTSNTSISGIGATGGTTLKTITLADNSGAYLEIYGSGLKGSDICINKIAFSIYRTTGAMTITRLDSEEYSDGTDTGGYFEIESSGNDAVVKAYTNSGTWTVNGEIRSLTGGTITYS